MDLQTFTGEVLRLAFGGQGIVHHDSLVIFVPFTAPGDLIRYRITQRKKNFAFGELLEVIKSSPQRTSPPCPYFGTCGGCQLQHLKYEYQLEHKRQCLEDALLRQAQIKNVVVPPVTPATHQWAYRRRISLTLKPHEGHYIAGYTGVDNTSLISVLQCPIFASPSDPIIKNLQQIAGSLANKDRTPGKVTVLKKDEANYLIHFHFKSMPKNATDVLKTASERFPAWQGILATSPHETIQFGSPEAHFDIEGLSLTFSPKAFIQNHPEQSVNIYKALCQQAKKYCHHHLLDLYCGIGISSILLAREGLNVTGVENNEEAIRLANMNAKKNHISHANFIKAEVENVLPSLLKKTSSDVVIVNPPREGLHTKVIEALIETAPQSIFYISCMPPTLARDLKILTATTFKLTEVHAYDMFPQTSHLETLAILENRHRV